MRADGSQINKQHAVQLAAQRVDSQAKSSGYLGGIYDSFNSGIESLQDDLNKALEVWINNEALLNTGTQAMDLMLKQVKVMMDLVTTGAHTMSGVYNYPNFVSLMTSYMVALGIPESQIVVTDPGPGGITLKDVRENMRLISEQMQTIQQNTQKNTLTVFALFTQLKSTEKMQSSTMATIYEMLRGLARAVAA